MIRAAYGMAALACTLFGVTNLGRGSYIYLKAHLAQYLLDDAWARTQAGAVQARPWPWADLWPIGRLRVPTHDVDLLVLPDDTGRTLAFGPGHAADTPAPGEPGISVVSGHRDTHMAFLRDVQVGDRISLETADKVVHWYRVTRSDIVDSRTAQLVDDPDAHAMLLVTCYPFDAPVPGGPLRYVVTADAIPAPR